MPSQSEIIARLPRHLRPFVGEQRIEQYSARDHAVWRFTLHQLARRLKDTAHPVYLEGLARTGISLDHVPSIDEMNQALAAIDWCALVVDGFIPPAIFMEFQARRVLVIAQAMRSVEHILYTPAPDIVHESAGHAPFIVDIDYAEYLQRFGEIGMKAISSAEDFAVFRAIRHLSIVKEDPRASAADVQRAEAQLQQCLRDNPQDSEAARLSRLHWWTVEYGLVGTLDDYRLFGAGLLSSLGESVNCLNDARVKKIPLTVDAVDQAYDITREQPQLFVTRSCRHMSQVLEEFAASMAFERGGEEGLRRAIDSRNVCTAQYSSGVQVSGRFTTLLSDAVDNPVYIGTQGPTQLAFEGTELEGHGTATHAAGFGAPVGKLVEMPRCLSKYTVDELKAAGIALGQVCALEFLSGIRVQGRLQHITRQAHRNLIFSFSDCEVRDRHGARLFEPDWGTYDMAIGARIVSVFGGVADPERFQLYEDLIPEPTPQAEPDADTARLFELYAQMRALRESGAAPMALAPLHAQLKAWPEEWLIRLELLDICPPDQPLATTLRHELEALAGAGGERARLIRYGLEALAAA